MYGVKPTPTFIRIILRISDFLHIIGAGLWTFTLATAGTGLLKPERPINDFIWSAFCKQTH